MKALWLIPIISLSGCAVAATDIQASCLPLVAYTKEDQTKFADELADVHAAGKYPLVERLLGDFLAMRNADRVCLKLGKEIP